MKTDTNMIQTRDEGNLLRITPNLPATLKNAKVYEIFFSNFKPDRIIDNVILDCADIKEFDSYFIILTAGLKHKFETAGIAFKIESMSPELEQFYNALISKTIKFPAQKVRKSRSVEYFEHIGNAAKLVFEDARNFTEFIGELSVKMSSLIIHPSRMRWHDFPYHFTRAGVDALFIVLLIVFLIGVISGYQGALQLAQFGADKFIADLVGISITRELSPLMAAILIAGRSGSAFAAEIGTMKVSEEVDALRSMGFDVMQFLVLPRVLAVMLAAPILTMFGNIAGIAGGMISAISTLDVTMSGYLNELQIAVSIGDIISGLGKSVIFGFLIATMGCFRGLQVSGGAESVGKYTTASVVSGVLLIILADAVFTFVFQSIGI